jgi:hypothetical protein
VTITPIQVQALSPFLGVKYRLARAEFEIDIHDFLAQRP